MFPVIFDISQVKPYIEGFDEFIIAERDWGFVVNYLVNKETTFNDDNMDIGEYTRRECRGLKFNKEGKILARPYHKFFNVNERVDTRLENIDFTKKHVILEKLDGSMIHPILVEQNWDNERICYRLVSKMGITDVALNAEHFVADNDDYQNFIRSLVRHGYTPIFEWCSRKNRIVIDYPEDRLVLTAIRHNITGIYVDFHTMKVIANSFDIDCVRALDIDGNMNDFIEFVRGQKDIEGFVIRFDDGHMFKIKADDYLRMHRAKDSMTHEKNVIYIFFNDMFDDFKSALNDADNARMTEFYNKVMNDFMIFVNTTFEEIVELKKRYTDRKNFALNAKCSNIVRKLMFKFWDSEVTVSDIHSELKILVLRACHSQNAVDSVRYMWNNHNWNYGVSDE